LAVLSSVANVHALLLIVDGAPLKDGIAVVLVWNAVSWAGLATGSVDGWLVNAWRLGDPMAVVIGEEGLGWSSGCAAWLLIQPPDQRGSSASQRRGLRSCGRQARADDPPRVNGG
jgi:hypothetical protein